MESQSHGLIKFHAWLLVNWKRLALGGGAAFAIAIIVIMVVQYQTQREVRASEALSNVRGAANPGAVPPAGTADAYFKVAREHAGTRAAARALLQGAGTLFVEGRYTESQKQFESFLGEYPDSQWIAQASLAVAACLDALGKTNEAVAKYEELRRRYGGDPIVDEAKVALGRLYEGQGKNEAAYQLYEEVAKGGMGFQSGLGMEARMRLEELAKKHPELAKPKQPIIAPTSTTPATTGSNVQVLRLTNQPIKPGTNLAQKAVTNAPVLSLTNRPTTNAPLLLQPMVKTNK
jgi:tetratricopeptide (TPR) repeat protein